MAEPPAEIALDDEQLAPGGISLLAVGELARQGQPVERALPDDEIAGLSRRLAGSRGREALLDDLSAVAGVLLEILDQAVRNRCLDLALHLGVAKLGLRLTLELRIGQLHADDRRQALPDVVAGEVAVGLLQDAGLAGPVVERARQRRTKTGDVRPTIDGIDVVREGKDVLGVRVVVLERRLDEGPALIALDVDRPAVQRLLVPVQVPHERLQATLEVERPLAVDPLIDEPDPDLLGQVGRLAQALRDELKRVFGRLEHARIRTEQGPGASALALRPDLLHRARRLPKAVFLGPDAAVACGLDPKPLGQRVDDAHADAMQAARHLVATAAELAAGVQNGMDDLERILPRGVLANRDATTVVNDLDGAVGLDRDLDLGGIPRHGLVDRVVDDLPDEMVKPTFIGRADVHARASANRLQAFEDLDAVGGVVGAGLGALAARTVAVRGRRPADRRADRRLHRRLGPGLGHAGPPTRRW